MRVLAITSIFPNARQPNRGIFNLQQFEALCRHSDLRVIAPLLWQPWFHGFSRSVPYEERWSGIRTLHPHYVYPPRLGRAGYAACMVASIQRAVARTAEEYRPDVLLGMWAYPDAVATGVLARRLGLPWVASVLGSDVNVQAAAPWVRRQIRWALSQACCTMAVSRPLKERLVEIGVPAERVQVLHNGIDVQRFRLQNQADARRALGLPADRRIVLYIGNLEPIKGVSDLLMAAREMARGGDHPPLVVLVGTGSAERALAEQVRRDGLSGDVRLAGAQPHREIPVWIAAADLICLPSHNEGCPNVVLEALACGRPVVASHVGAVPDLIDASCGRLVAPGEPTQLAGALLTALSQSWDAPAIRERVLPRSWEANARVLASALSKAVDSQ